MCPQCFQWDMQILLPWNIPWEFVSVSLQFIILKLGSRDRNSGRERWFVQDLWRKPQAEAVFPLEQHTWLCPEDELPVLISPLGRSYFWMFYGAQLLFLCPWSLSHTEIALGIATALEEADGDLATCTKICLKFVSSFKPSASLQVFESGLLAIQRGRG